MIGSRLQHFEITAKLGEGGMGAVYRATDSRLGREVAIKVLPDTFAGDADRLARFEREARALASLNHPNIASIYEVGAHDATHFLVMELASGESLADRIARGPLEVEESLRIGLQLCRALEAAHEVGIVHRDLKPANVQVSASGEVKVLDFGLAKIFDEEPDSDRALTQSPTLTQRATQAGVLMGTAAYMSPEQARGQAADRRSDVWSFGVVLWEMLAGRRLFDGATLSDTLAAVLREEVDLASLPEELPASARRLLRRCLERDPVRRLQHIGDARLELEDALAESPEADRPVEGRSAGRWRAVAAAAALVALAASGLALWSLVGREPTPAAEPWAALIETEPLVTVFPPAIAPDGRRGLYSTGDRLWLWQLDRFGHRSWEGEFQRPFFSPDSRHIGFERAGSLWRMNIESGEIRRICALPARLVNGAHWSSDGTIVFATWSPNSLYRVPEEGGEVVQLGGPFDRILDLNGALPDGRGLVFTNSAEGGIDLLVDGEWTSLLRGEDVTYVVYHPSGHLLYHLPESGLWALPFDANALVATAGPVQLDPIGTWPTVSSDGRLSYRRGLDRNQFVLVGRDGRVSRRIGRPQFMLQDPAVSPDGRSVAGVSSEQGQFALWIHDVDSSQARRLTFDVRPALDTAAWSGDGRYLYFSDFGGAFFVRDGTDLWRVDVQGEEAPQPVGDGWAPHVSADGRYLVHLLWGEPGTLPGELASAEGPQDIYYRSLEEGGASVALVESPASEDALRLSPDGRYLAYSSDESGREELYVRRFPSGEGRWQVSTEGGTDPRWSADGGELFFVSGRELMAVAVETRNGFAMGEPRRLFTVTSPSFYEYDVTPDGEFVLVLPGEERSTIAVVDQWQRFFESGGVTGLD